MVIGALLALAIVTLVTSEVKSFRLGVWLFKPAASTLFVIGALRAGAWETSYGQLMLLGLAFSWAGDLLLIPKRPPFFLCGLGSFLLAHLAYGGAFLQLPLAILPLIVAAIAMALIARHILQRLWPFVPNRVRPAILLYFGAISLMVALAGGTLATAGAQLIGGALLFAASDLFVARHRFVRPGVTNKLWGLPLYYAAQMIFAWSPRWLP